MARNSKWRDKVYQVVLPLGCDPNPNGPDWAAVEWRDADSGELLPLFREPGTSTETAMSALGAGRVVEMRAHGNFCAAVASDRQRECDCGAEWTAEQ